MKMKMKTEERNARRVARKYEKKAAYKAALEKACLYGQATSIEYTVNDWVLPDVY